MSLAAALCGMLAFILARVLSKDIRLKVVIQDGQLEVKEPKQTQKVSTSLQQSNSTILWLIVVLKPLCIELAPLSKCFYPIRQGV